MTERLVILGGGVIGSSIAWEALRRGFSVMVLDRPDLAGRASWAGAGILSPGHAVHSLHPLERMAGRSTQLHLQWSRDLLDETGLENGLLQCGGVYLATTRGEAAGLGGQMSLWSDEQIPSRKIPIAELQQLLGSGFVSAVTIEAAWQVDAEMQIDNAQHLGALRAACTARGCDWIDLAEQDSQSLTVHQNRSNNLAHRLSMNSREIEIDWLCFAAGAWTGGIAKQLGCHLPTTPVRGQMLLYKLPARDFVPVVNLGSRYIVPRADGHVLVGSTMEEAGFDASTTADGIASLKSFASPLFPALNDSTLVRAWAGLRPASFDGMPYIGPLASSPNIFAATGHLRSGLQLSTATATMICDLIERKPVDPELERLTSPNRFSSVYSSEPGPKRD